MAWKFDRKAGRLTSPTGTVASAYSGLGPYKDDPSSEQIKGMGVIPAGTYHIGRPYDSPNVGPLALPLEAMPGTEVYGRGDFRIHGDSKEHPGQASHGCVIVDRATRIAIAASDDDKLEVL